jgi:hypothetical protein
LGQDGAVLAFLELTVAPAFAVMTAEERQGDWVVRSPSTAFQGPADRPLVAVGPADEAVVVWRHIIDGTGHVLRATRDVGGRWRDPQQIGQAPHYPFQTGSSDMLIGLDGEVLHTWTETHDAYIGVGLERRAPGDTAFEALPGVLSVDTLFANEPRLALNPQGDALVAWYQSVGDALMVFVSERSRASGSFTRPGDASFLSPPGAPVEGPVPAIADDATAVVAWRQENPHGMAVYLAERRDGQWSVPADLDAVFSTPTEHVGDVQAAFVVQQLFVVWSVRVGPHRAIHLAHRAADGEWLASGTDPLVLSDDGAFDPHLTVSAHGEVMVAWLEDMGGYHRVVSRQSSIDLPSAIEADRWSEPVVHSSETLGNAGNAVAAIAASGDRAMIAWEQAGAIQLATLD